MRSAVAGLSLVTPFLFAAAVGAPFALGQAAMPPAGQLPNPQPVVGLGDVPSPAGAPAVGVVPGGVARWAGEGIERCGDTRETWPPLDGACYYPVDLGQPAGTLEVYRETAGRRGTAKLRVLPPPYAEESLRVDPRKVRLSKKNRLRADREREVVVPLFSLRTNPAFSLPLGSPLRNAPPPRNFGKRRLFNGEPRSAHGGADYRAPTGTSVLAAEAGLVVLAAHHFFAGKSVFVDHGGGLISIYMHLSRLDVKAGQRVAKGDRLGLSGATGRVTGPHLHFGLRWRGAKVDPALLLGDPVKLPSP
jgi:murein DD-endopeptidase MepM/ murein hydrolase activator NlpD